MGVYFSLYERKAKMNCHNCGAEAPKLTRGSKHCPAGLCKHCKAAHAIHGWMVGFGYCEFDTYTTHQFLEGHPVIKAMFPHYKDSVK